MGLENGRETKSARARVRGRASTASGSGRPIGLSQHLANLVSRKQVRILTEQEVRRLANKLDLVDENFNLSHYVPPGPVARSFILSNAPTAVIMGPLGGGKTTACVFKRIYAGTQAPIAIHPDDGVRTRMCRWIVLRDTFRSAEKTVLESWKQWFSKTYPGSSWTGGNDRPVTHILRFRGTDGVRIEMITEFAGLNEADIETLMKGREYSGVWLNEIDTHAEGSLDDAEQRVGRYPKSDALEDPDQERLAMVIGDMNAPTIDNWTYKPLVTERKSGRAFFQQPSGVSPMAENRLNLKPDYYQRIIENQDEHFVRRMVHNEFGYSRKGKPVHPSFERNRHVAPGPIRFNPNLDLLIGIDISTNALTPAAVFGQNDGRIKFINELWPGHGFGPVRFGELLKQMIDQHYANARRIRIWADPASMYGGDKEGGQLAALDILSNILQLPIEVPFGGSNELSLRLGAVDMELRGYLEPNTSLLICPQNCPLVIEALAGKYQFRKLSQNASNEFEDLPEKKHPASDLMDAGQYLIGGVRGRHAIIKAGAEQSQRQGGNPSTGPSGGWGKAQSGGWGKSSGFDPRKVGL